jgi:predicted amidophosphoribosyltransferase
VYLRRHLVLEPWGAPAPALLELPAACPECGRAVRDGDAFCGACGASVAHAEVLPPVSG